MQVDAIKKLFTVDDYHRMGDAGIIGIEERTELIEGEVITMSPIGDRHAIAVNIATDRFTNAFRGQAIVSVQNPLRLSLYTEPQPDLVLLRYRSDFYKGRKWRPEDALLVLEVSETTLRFDRKVKLPLYAAAGVTELWIENLEAEELLVFRNPTGRAYSTALSFHRDDFVSVEAFPDQKFKVDDLLP